MYMKKSLAQYLTEKIKQLPRGVKGLIVFDIDDTILKVNKDSVRIYKKVPGQQEISMTTDEFAKDPDAANLENRSWYDYRDFKDPTKVYNSIITGTPLLRNIRILDDYLDAGYDFCFLSARSCEAVVKEALGQFLSTKPSGEFRKIEESFKKSLSAAVNDQYKHYPGRTDAEKKANVLKELCSQYDRVVFVDDDKKNVSAARDLDIPNLRVIKAWS